MILHQARPVVIVALVSVCAAATIAQAARVKVGGDVKRPPVLKIVSPEYPKDARDKKIDGTVLLDIVIATDGTVLEAEVAKGVYPSLDAAAVKAVRQWKYLPTKVNDQPVEVILTGVEVTFKL